MTALLLKKIIWGSTKRSSSCKGSMKVKKVGNTDLLRICVVQLVQLSTAPGKVMRTILLFRVLV